MFYSSFYLLLASLLRYYVHIRMYVCCVFQEISINRLIDYQSISQSVNQSISVFNCMLPVNQVEDEVLRQQIEQYNETMSRYHHQQQQLHLEHHHHHGEMLDVQRPDPSDVVQALLDISTIPASTGHLESGQTNPGHWMTTFWPMSSLHPSHQRYQATPTPWFIKRALYFYYKSGISSSICINFVPL